MRLDDTGRLRDALWPTAHRAANKHGKITLADLPQLKRQWQIHQAHALMLIECGIEARAAQRVVAALVQAEDSGFAALLGVETPRGLYLASERWLFQVIGNDAGVLHTGRSRNDLNATEQRLALRDAWRKLTGQLLSLAHVLSDRAFRDWDLPMPLHTHYQPAVISTYGHWLAGCAEGILRLHARALNEVPHLNLCPLGAVAIGGTSHPIDPRITARLLGFDRPFTNSVDAIATKDHILSLMGLAVNAAHLVSRIAQDYRFRTSTELAWFTLPDGLAGGSSALPQKKNAWLLELAITRCTRVFGVFVAFFTSAFSEPFSNTIPAGSEALAGSAEAVNGLAEALTLLRLHIRHLEPDRSALERSLRTGFPFAQALAEDLARQGGTARAAHYNVGRMVRDQVGSFQDVGITSQLHETKFLDPALLSYGGGAGSVSREEMAKELDTKIAEETRRRHEAIRQWKKARTLMYKIVRDPSGILNSQAFTSQTT